MLYIIIICMIIHMIVLFIIAISVLGVSIANRNTIRYCITNACIIHTRNSVQVVMISHYQTENYPCEGCYDSDNLKHNCYYKYSLLLFTLL